jgi:site-specific recombinase XerD
MHAACMSVALMLVHLAADVKTVQSLLGHTDIRTTALYLTGRKEEKKTAINKLNGLLTANNKSELSA